LPDASNDFEKSADIAPAIKPLISLLPATVHGVVFDFLLGGSQVPQAEPDFIRL